MEPWRAQPESLVARQEPRIEWQDLARRYDARFGVVECLCSDEAVHRSRVEGRSRDIPGWYELTWAHVAAGRERYLPLPEPKISLDAVDTRAANLERVKRELLHASLSP